MQVDECTGSQESLEQLNKLPPVLKKEGTATARNVPGVSDTVIASEDAVKKPNLPLWKELWAILCLDPIPLT